VAFLSCIGEEKCNERINPRDKRARDGKLYVTVLSLKSIILMMRVIITYIKGTLKGARVKFTSVFVTDCNVFIVEVKRNMLSVFPSL